MVALSKCARSSSIGSSGLVFAYRSLGSLLHHLWSIYIVSGASNSPDSASTRSNDLVGLPGVADTCRSQFQSSSATGWVRRGVRSSVVVGKWIGWPRYVVRRSFISSVLTRLESSQRSRFESFRLAACAARCTIHPAPSPIVSGTSDNVSAPPIALDVAHRHLLTLWTLWTSNLT